jgi:hypothetical protein
MTKNGRPISWLSTKHGDRVTLKVSQEDQENGIPGSPTGCAVVQTILRSSPDVYKAKVIEGNINVWVHGSDAKDWRGRLIMDRTTRTLAMKYDEEIASAPTEILLIVDKWHEVHHYKRVRKTKVASDTSKEQVQENEQEQMEKQLGEQLGEQTEQLEEQLEQLGEQPENFEQKFKYRRRAKKSRWDVSNYLVPSRVKKVA